MTDRPSFFGNGFLGGTLLPETHDRGRWEQPFDPAFEFVPRHPRTDVVQVPATVE